MGKKMSNFEKFTYVGDPVVCKGEILRDIEAVKTFVCNGVEIKAGTRGGRIREGSLSQKGSCWVFRGALVRGESSVEGHAAVMGGTVVDSDVCGNAVITGDRSYISGGSNISGEVRLDNCTVEGSSVSGNLPYANELISNRRVSARKYKDNPEQPRSSGVKICGGFINPGNFADQRART